MRNARRSLWISLLIALASFTWSPAARHASADSPIWMEVAPGIEYRQFLLNTPNRVYVARMHRRFPNLTIESSLGQGKVNGGLETVRQMAQREDQSINYWGERWGNRSQAIVAINGFFYDPESGIPRSGLIKSGWYAKRFDERQRDSGFVWTLDRQAFIGSCIAHPTRRQTITVLDNRSSFLFEGINTPAKGEQLIIYTPQFDAFTPFRQASLEILVALEQPMTILPAPNMVLGVVRAIIEGNGNTPLPFDHVVLSSSGANAQAMKQAISVGSKIGISQEVRHFQSDCRTPRPIDWSKAYTAIGTNFTFLIEGRVQSFTDIGSIFRVPRTAIAYNEEYIFFIVVDGRQPFESHGMSIVELAVFAKNYLGATWGAGLDGGGSSTMVVLGELKNHPVTETSPQTLPGAPQTLWPTAERAVANSLIMALVLPKETSEAFEPGEAVVVQANEPIPLFAGPGSDFAIFTHLAPGTSGIILDHALNGVLAKGVYWWNVRFESAEGWISQEYLRVISASG